MRKYYALTSPVPTPSLYESFSPVDKFVYFGIKMAVSKSWKSLHSSPMDEGISLNKT